MSEEKIFKFTESIWAELLLSILMGIPLGFCATGLYYHRLLNTINKLRPFCINIHINS